MLTYSLHPDITLEIRRKMRSLREADSKRTRKVPKMHQVSHERSLLK